MSSSDSEQCQMEVIPVLPTDQQKPIDNIRTRTFFIVNQQLDEDVLRNALDRLIRDHWRKLGARLFKRPRDGVLEWHLPKVFDEKYVLFRWSSKVYDHAIDITGLPKTTPPKQGVVLLPSPEAVDKWFRPSDWPFTQKDEPNAPLLLVHISTFTDDTTVIAISCPHTVGDQCGMANIMKAWLGLTKGEVPPAMVGFNEDVIPKGKEYSEYQKEEIVRRGRSRVRRTGEYSLIAMGMIPELILRPTEVKHSLFVPVPVVESLKERHTKALKEKYGTDPGLTNGDILTGILMKFSQIHSTSKRKMSMSQYINRGLRFFPNLKILLTDANLAVRRRVPKLEGDAADAFIHNSLHCSTAHFKLEPSTPVAEIAYQNRLALKQALDPKDIEIGMTVVREMVRRGQSILTCEPFERLFTVTSWTSAWRPLDFSSVVKGQENVKEGSRRPKLLVLGEGREYTREIGRYMTTIMCKTEEGYWCSFAMPVKGMKMVEEYLKKDPMLELL